MALCPVEVQLDHITSSSFWFLGTRLSGTRHVSKHVQTVHRRGLRMKEHIININ